MVINTNIASMQSARLLTESVSNQGKALSRLASGSRITSPEDDAAGLAQSAKLNSESLRHRAALTTLQNSLSFFQTKDGYLQKVEKAINRMNELAMLAMDSTKTDEDRQNYDREFQTLNDFLESTADKSFNGKHLFYGEYELVNSGVLSWSDAKDDAEANGGHLASITNEAEFNFAINQLGGGTGAFGGNDVWLGGSNLGPQADDDFKWVTGEPVLWDNWLAGQPDTTVGDKFIYSNGEPADGANIYTWASPLGGTAPAYILEKGVSVVVDGDGNTINLANRGIPTFQDNLNTISAAQTAVRNTTNAIVDVAANRAEVGSSIQRIRFESEELSLLAQNLDASVSRIQDTDIAVESTVFARTSILTQSGTAMLAQANVIPEIALRLLT